MYGVNLTKLNFDMVAAHYMFKNCSITVYAGFKQGEWAPYRYWRFFLCSLYVHTELCNTDSQTLVDGLKPCMAHEIIQGGYNEYWFNYTKSVSEQSIFGNYASFYCLWQCFLQLGSMQNCQEETLSYTTNIANYDTKVFEHHFSQPQFNPRNLTYKIKYATDTHPCNMSTVLNTYQRVAPSLLVATEYPDGTATDCFVNLTSRCPLCAFSIYCKVSGMRSLM
jgi:hypothetical protein